MKNDPTKDEVYEALKHLEAIVIILSGKGGVGKSTVTFKLANYLSSSSKSKKKVTILDTDLCGPSMPSVLKCEDAEINNSNVGWEPVSVTENLGVISSGFMLPNKDSAVI
mmetsp:Transcript_29724/g.65104  ORF Transcript_29724/g.65104 Transcript_29724/m.65104 type:complete len:110 (-) Transcript_29724:73-402(-)